MIMKEFSDLLELSATEQVQLAKEKGNRIAEYPEAVDVTDSQKQELDRRLYSFYKNPDTGSPWNEVKEKVLASK